MDFYSKYVPNGSKICQNGLKWSQVGTIFGQGGLQMVQDASENSNVVVLGSNMWTMLGHFGSMLPSNARIDATSKNGHTTTHPPKQKGGGWKKKGSQMAPIWSTKVSMERHMTAKLRHCPKMKMFEKRYVFHYFWSLRLQYMNHVGSFWVFGFMLSSDACIDASSKTVTEKIEKA